MKAKSRGLIAFIALGSLFLCLALWDGAYPAPKPVIEDDPLPDSIERLLPPGVASGFRKLTSAEKVAFYNDASPRVQEAIRKIW